MTAVALHPVDAANERLAELGYTPAQARAFSVFGGNGESALVNGALLAERFVSLDELATLVAALPRLAD